MRAQDISDDTVHALDSAGGVVVKQIAEDKLCTEGLVQANPERAREARVANLDVHVRQTHVAEHRGHEVPLQVCN